MANQYSGESQGSGSKGVGGAVEDLRDRTSTALTEVSGSTAEQIDNSPLLAVAGGIALGAVIAAVLPASDRERQLLQPVGSKVAGAGRDAIERVRETGKAKVDELAGDKVREFFGMGGSSSSGSSSDGSAA